MRTTGYHIQHRPCPNMFIPEPVHSQTPPMENAVVFGPSFFIGGVGLGWTSGSHPVVSHVSDASVFGALHRYPLGRCKMGGQSASEHRQSPGLELPGNGHGVYGCSNPKVSFILGY